MKILVIPDGHASPLHDNERFRWAGRLIARERPDIVVDMGDRATMDSISQYDAGKLVAEGRRYVEDLRAVHEATELLNEEVDMMNNRFVAWKKKKYTPTKYICLGNHEQRVVRAYQENPSMYGHIALEDLKYDESGWISIPFLTPLIIEDILFQHYITSGIMGRPVGGEHHSDSLLSKGKMSTVVGHSHMRGFSETTNGAGNKMCSLVSGCYFEHDEHYTSENARFWRGLIILHGVKDGYFDPEFISINKIKEEYS